MRCARMMSIWWRCAWPSPHRVGVGQTALRESLRPRSIRLPRRLAACPPSGRVVVRRRARPARAAAMTHRSAWNHLPASYGGSLGSQALTRSSRMRRQPKSRYGEARGQLGRWCPYDKKKDNAQHQHCDGALADEKNKRHRRRRRGRSTVRLR